MASPATKAFKSGDKAFYSNSGGTYRARIKRMHSDGTVSIVSLFAVGPDGKDIFPPLGFNFRIDADRLRSTHAA